MSYFRTNSKKQKHSSSSSIDGFVRQDRTPLSQSTSSQTSPVSKRSSRLDDFRGAEGFSPSRNPTLSLPSHNHPEEDFSNLNNLDNFDAENEIKPKKRRFFRRKKDKKKLTNGQKAAKVFAVFCIISVLFIVGIIGYAFFKANRAFRGDGEGAAALEANVDPVKLRGEGDGRINILLLGKGGEGHTAPDLTDTILLASIDPVQNEASLLSVPRDMYVKDKNGAQMKINAIYATAKQKKLATDRNNKDAAEDEGLKAIREQVTTVLGVPIHYHVMVDFEAFREVINTVGGVTINVEEAVYDTIAFGPGGGPLLIADKGTQTFMGEQALYYARTRHGSARGDFDRTERQRQIIVALKEKVLSIGTFSDPFKVINIVNSLGNHVRSDIDLTKEMPRLYELAKQINADKISSVGLADPPNVLVQTANIGGLSVVVPKAGNFIYDDIQSFVRNSIKDSFLKNENAGILILNGTTKTGLASKTSKELKSYGYNVLSVADAPTRGYQKTILVDLTNGQKRYTKSYLERRLSVTSVSALPDSAIQANGADFVIILGEDEATRVTN
jgi:polyisoprenyl-teichoic acid--peptidoglycan teichoic acid transferase